MTKPELTRIRNKMQFKEETRILPQRLKSTFFAQNFVKNSRTSTTANVAAVVSTFGLMEAPPGVGKYM